MEENVNIALA